MTIVFTDLVRFSDWALGAGDTAATELLRQVDRQVTPALTDRGGRVVKRLGDGLMATFLEPEAAVDAVLDAQEAIAAVDVLGERPLMRVAPTTGSRAASAATTSASTSTSPPASPRPRRVTSCSSRARFARPPRRGSVQDQAQAAVPGQGAPGSLGVYSVARR